MRLADALSKFFTMQMNLIGLFAWSWKRVVTNTYTEYIRILENNLNFHSVYSFSDVYWDKFLVVNSANVLNIDFPEFKSPRRKKVKKNI